MNGPVESDGNLPLVSVIVRTYGQRRHLLRECLQSIAAQDYRKIEIVVVEDGSSQSAECVQQFRDATDLAVQYHSIAKGGRCRAGNKGLESASGSLLNFLDDDDQFYPHHVGLLATKLGSRPDLAAAYALSLKVPMSIQSYDPLVYTLEPGYPFRGGPFSLGRLCYQNFLPIQSVMFRRELFLRHGGFDVELERLEDWNLWIRYFTTGDAEFIDEVTSSFRVPVALREHLQRSATLDRYYRLALQKQREAGPHERRSNRRRRAGNAAFQPLANTASVRCPPLDRRQLLPPGARRNERQVRQSRGKDRAAIARRHDVDKVRRLVGVSPAVKVS